MYVSCYNFTFYRSFLNPLWLYQRDIPTPFIKHIQIIKYVEENCVIHIRVFIKYSIHTFIFVILKKRDTIVREPLFKNVFLRIHFGVNIQIVKRKYTQPSLYHYMKPWANTLNFLWKYSSKPKQARHKI